MGWGDDIVTHLIPKAKQGRCENGAFVVLVNVFLWLR